MLGGLHIEMAGLKLIRDWLEDSGWVEPLVQAKLASSGIADSCESHTCDTNKACTPSHCQLPIYLTQKVL